MNIINQYAEVGKSLAELIHYTMAWDEPLNGYNIEEITKYFETELKILNGD